MLVFSNGNALRYIFVYRCGLCIVCSYQLVAILHTKSKNKVKLSKQYNRSDDLWVVCWLQASAVCFCIIAWSVLFCFLSLYTCFFLLFSFFLLYVLLFMFSFPFFFCLVCVFVMFLFLTSFFYVWVCFAIFICFDLFFFFVLFVVNVLFLKKLLFLWSFNIDTIVSAVVVLICFFLQTEVPIDVTITHAQNKHLKRCLVSFGACVV